MKPRPLNHSPGEALGTSFFYHRRLRARWASGRNEGLPAPWSKVQAPHVGGLHSVGIDAPGRYLLTISIEGRGVIDCLTGEKVARDYSEREGDWLDRVRLTAIGIGPLEGKEIRVAGDFIGGGFPACTRDDWSLHRSAMLFPSEAVWAEPPTESKGFYMEGTFYKLWTWDSPFAAGFSESGTTLIIACSNQISIWTR